MLGLDAANELKETIYKGWNSIELSKLPLDSIGSFCRYVFSAILAQPILQVMDDELWKATVWGDLWHYERVPLSDLESDIMAITEGNGPVFRVFEMYGTLLTYVQTFERHLRSNGPTRKAL